MKDYKIAIAVYLIFFKLILFFTLKIIFILWTPHSLTKLSPHPALSSAALHLDSWTSCPLSLPLGRVPSAFIFSFFSL